MFYGEMSLSCSWGLSWNKMNKAIGEGWVNSDLLFRALVLKASIAWSWSGCRATLEFGGWQARHAVLFCLGPVCLGTTPNRQHDSLVLVFVFGSRYCGLGVVRVTARSLDQTTQHVRFWFSTFTFYDSLASISSLSVNVNAISAAFKRQLVKSSASTCIHLLGATSVANRYGCA